MTNPLQVFAGDWKGDGIVRYPTETFGKGRQVPYEEHLRFTVLNPQVVYYEQVFTAHKESKKPMHRESGWIKVVDVDTGTLEMNISQITGLNEMGTGKLIEEQDGSSWYLQFECNSFQRTASSASKCKIDPTTNKTNMVTSIRREYRISKPQTTNNASDYTMQYTISMTTESQEPMTEHLTATLHHQL